MFNGDFEATQRFRETDREFHVQVVSFPLQAVVWYLLNDDHHVPSFHARLQNKMNGGCLNTAHVYSR